MSNENNLIPPSPQLNIDSLSPFTRFCCSIGMIPSSYKASLTYEEQLMWLCDYLENTVIPTVNNNGEVVTELQNLFVQLKSYVDNYFTNLDVQQEINNKLDEMASDGTLISIIAPYLQPFIEEQNNRITQLENFVYASTNINPLVASSTSEMTDTTRIYVNTTDGHWYYYDGTIWADGGIYQATGIGYDSISLINLANDTKENLNARINNVDLFNQTNENTIINLSNIIDNINIDNQGNIGTDTILTRVSTKYYIYKPKNTTIRLIKNDLNLNITAYCFDKNFNLILNSQFNNILIFSNDINYILLKFQKSDNTQNLTVNEVLENITIQYERLYIKNIYENGNNLFNKNDYYENLVLQNNGYIASPNQNYNVSKPIKVKKNQPYTISKFRNFGLYDDSFSLIQNSYISDNTTNYTFTPTEDGYIIFTYSKSNNNIMVNKGNSLLNYEDYKLYLPENVEMNSNINILNGKKLVTCGDSFTAYTNATFDDGLYVGQDKTYPYLIALRNNMVLQQLAVSGSTITNVEGDQMKFSVNEYQNIANDADYILIKYGINDEHLNATIGTIDDNTNDTFYGAWNVVLKYIINHHPLAKIGIIVTNGLTLNTQQPNNSYYADAIINIARKYGIPTLNEWNDPNIPLLLRTGRNDVLSSIRNLRRDTFKVSNDNLHPNYLCHQYESTIIENFLRSL